MTDVHLDRAYKNAAKLFHKSVAFVASSRKAQQALQIAGTCLILILLTWLVRSAMNDDEAGVARYDSIKSESGINFFDEDESERQGSVEDSTGEDADSAILDTSRRQKDENDELPAQKGIAEPLLVDDTVLRKQLHYFFKKHNPEKISGIDEIVKKYGDRQVELNELLQKKYGADLSSLSDGKTTESAKSKSTNAGERATSSTPKTTYPKRKDDPESKLRRFFEYHNPEKVSSVKSLIKKYSIKQLNSKLRSKYGTSLDDDISQIDASNEMATSFEILEKKATALFRHSRPKESKEWIQGFIEQYRGSISTQMRKWYGYTLDGDRAPVQYEDLKFQLREFFSKHNKERLASVDEAARRFVNDLDNLNALLRDKYGIDLAGKRKDKPTPVADLLRVDFSSAHHLSVANATRFVSSNFLNKILQEAREVPGDAIVSNQGTDLEADFDPDVRANTGVLDDDDSNVRVMCFGLPLTGCDLFQDFSNSVLRLRGPSEYEAFEMLSHSLPGPTALPNWDSCGQFGALSASTFSYYFEELSLAFPKAKIVIAVRSVDSWWQSIRKQDDWFCVDRSTSDDNCRTQQAFLDALFFGHTSDHSSSRVEKLHRQAYYAFYERLLQTIPQQRRVLVDMYGGVFRDSTLENLAKHFGKPVGDWLKSNTAPAKTERSESASMLRLLHRPQAAVPQSDTGFKLLSIGLDASGSESVADVVSNSLGLSAALTSTRDWFDLLRDKGSCEDCDYVLGTIGGQAQTDNRKASGDMLAGLPCLVAAPLLTQRDPNLRIILALRRPSVWLPENRCMMRSWMSSSAKSLLRSDRTASFPTQLRSSFAFVYGHPVWKNSWNDASDYFLAKRYQSTVDGLVATISPQQLLAGDVQAGIWDRLCKFLSMKQDCSSIIRSSGEARRIKMYC